MSRKAPLALVALLPLLMGSTERLVRAEGRLQQGRFRIAIELFKAELGDDPASGRAKRGLARAYEGMQNCDGALPLLAEIRPTEWWNADAALVEGDCRLRNGDTSAAIAAYQEAQLQDLRPEVQFKMAMALRELGDRGALDAALVDLQGMEGDRVGNLVAIARAWAAYDAGGDVAWEGLAELREQLAQTGSAQGDNEADTIEGLLWLDEGNPVEAERHFQAASQSRSPIRSASWRCESLRRVGNLDDALGVWEAARNKAGDTPLKHAVMARVYTDLGDFARAESEIAAIPLADDPERLASAWYLARATGSPEASAYAAAWDAHPHPSSRTLDALIPWETP